MSAPGSPDQAALTAVLAAIDPALRLAGSRDLAGRHQACFGLAELPHLTDIRARAATRTGTWPDTLDESLSEAAVRAALAGHLGPAVLDLHAALRRAGKMAGWGMPTGRLAAMTAGHRAFVTSVLTGGADPDT